MKPDDLDAKIKFLVAETLRGVGGLVFDIAWHFKHYTGRRVTRFHDSCAALALDMGVLVSKMEESIAAHCQASLKTAQDPDGVVQRVLAASLGTHLLASRGSGKKFHRNVVPGADFTAPQT